MKTASLLVMVGGASSRMKKSLASASLKPEIKSLAAAVHKSLVPVDTKGNPLLYFLLRNAHRAGIREVFLITSPENEAFTSFVSELKKTSWGTEMRIELAVQYPPGQGVKPLGTADAVFQCLEQFPQLKKSRFLVCNGDNVYSKEAFRDLHSQADFRHSLIAYRGESLGHPLEKILRFSLLDFDDNHALISIIEKPDEEELLAYKSRHTSLWVSMNIFQFEGEEIYPFLRDCPIDPIRKEKELPTAVSQLIANKPGSVVCMQRSEKVPDLTSAQDLDSLSAQLE